MNIKYKNMNTTWFQIIALNYRVILTLTYFVDKFLNDFSNLNFDIKRSKII